MSETLTVLCYWTTFELKLRKRNIYVWLFSKPLLKLLLIIICAKYVSDQFSKKSVRLFLLQTVRLICLSKFPEGKVEMWQVYVAWSDSLVLIINSVESLIGSELVKRTRPAKLGNSTCKHTHTKGSGEGNIELGCVFMLLFFFYTRCVCKHLEAPLTCVSWWSAPWPRCFFLQTRLPVSPWHRPAV